MSELHTAEKAASECTHCALHQNRIKPVFARGVCIDFMICGMVPGPDENKAGFPFVGRSGQLLDVILEQTELVDKVYITNIVKCALKPGISLQQEWIDQCLAYLLVQIIELNPKVIITLGGDATNGLLGLPLDTKMKDLRGKVHEHLNIHVVPTYHPSYLLRGGGKKHKQYESVIKDFELAKFIWEDKR